MCRYLTAEQWRVIKGSRIILLRSLESLKANSLEKLACVMELNEPLYQAFAQGRTAMVQEPSERSSGYSIASNLDPRGLCNRSEEISQTR